MTNLSFLQLKIQNQLIFVNYDNKNLLVKIKILQFSFKKLTRLNVEQSLIKIKNFKYNKLKIFISSKAKQIVNISLRTMQKHSHHKAKVLQKVPLKNKLLVKAALAQKNELMVTRFGYEDTMAACGYDDGSLRVFNLSTDNKISQVSINPSPKQIIPINCLRWRPQNQSSSISSVILVGGTNGHLYQYAAKTGKQLFQTVQQDNYILAMDYHPEGTNFATAGKDNIIRIYDQQTKKITQQLKGMTWHKGGHNNRLFSIKYKIDEPDIMVSGGWDLNVNVWDRRTGDVVSTIFGPKIAGDGIDIRDNLILTAANRGSEQLQLWDWRQNKEGTALHTFRWDEQSTHANTFLFCTQFIKNSPNTIMACGGQQMKIFSLEDFSEMVEVRFDQGESLYSCDSSYGSNRYLVGGKLGVMFYLGSNKSFQ